MNEPEYTLIMLKPPLISLDTSSGTPYSISKNIGLYDNWGEEMGYTKVLERLLEKRQTVPIWTPFTIKYHESCGTMLKGLGLHFILIEEFCAILKSL